MEEVVQNWNSEEILEPLQPLTIEPYEGAELNSLNCILEQLSRHTKAEKLLDHFNELSWKTEEPDPLDWFSNEKSVNISIFESVQPIIQLEEEIEEYPKPTFTDNFSFESFKYEAPLLSPAFDLDHSVNESQLTYFSLTHQEVEPLNEAIVPTALVPKKEVLTPPDSPKSDLMKLFEEIEPEKWEQLTMETEPDENDTKPSVKSAQSTADRLSNFAGDDSYVESEEVSSDDNEYIPPWKQKKLYKKVDTIRRRKNGKSNDRTERKREQNKIAALRYRIKKKQVLEGCKLEEFQLSKKNKQLRAMFEDITREMKYLRTLLRDVYRKNSTLK